VLGGTAKEVKVERNLGPADNLRDNLDNVELSAVSLSESLAGEKIDIHALFGLQECERACRTSATAVTIAVISYFHSQ
jgi:hypothetical protein